MLVSERSELANGVFTEIAGLTLFEVEQVRAEPIDTIGKTDLVGNTEGSVSTPGDLR